MQKLIKSIKERTRMTCYRIEIDVNKSTTIFDSKLGGLPYWTPDKDYPLDSSGRKLLLLAQINFDNSQVTSPLPTNGMLQFFIADDEFMGIDFDDQITQKGFRIVYHENIDYSIVEDEIKNIGVPTSQDEIENGFPIFNNVAISLHKSETFMNTYDSKFPALVEEISGQGIENYDYEELRDALDEDSPNHKMLGYPYFTQEDPRYNEEYADFDTLLLQIDSEGDYVMWGDAGIGNFFIKSQDLLKKDFSRVLYNWDCY